MVYSFCIRVGYLRRSSASIRVARLRVWHKVNVISGVSESSAWHFVSLLPLSQWCPFISTTPWTWWGDWTSKTCPRVSLLASNANSAVAATVQRQLGHQRTTESSWFDKYPSGWVIYPNFWVRTPKATPDLSATYKVNSFFRSGIPRAGALIRAHLIFVNALAYSSVHRKKLSVWAFGSVI